MENNVVNAQQLVIDKNALAITVVGVAGSIGGHFIKT